LETFGKRWFNFPKRKGLLFNKLADSIGNGLGIGTHLVIIFGGFQLGKAKKGKKGYLVRIF